MRLVVLGWLGAVAACGPRPDVCADVAACDDATAETRGPCSDPDSTTSAVLSPVDGSVQRAPWLPLLVRADSAVASVDVTVCLEGTAVTDPTAIVRSRRESWGGGSDYLAWLDLEGVPAGEHVVRVFFGRGAGPVAVSRFTVDRSGHRVEVEVRDPAGTLVPARVLVTDGDDVRVPVVTLPVEADPSARDLEIHSLFAVDGRAVMWLPTGVWRFRAIRGVLDTVPLAEVTLVGDAEVPLVVAPAVDLPGVLTADLHVHTGRSYDSFVPDRARYESLAAAGLDVAVMTDHNEVVDPAEAMAHTLPEGVPLRGVAGIEHDIRRVGGTSQPDWDLGHMNAFPVEGPDVAPLPPKEVDPVGVAVGAWRRRQVEAPYPGVGSEVVLQLNHPRGIHFFPEDDPVREAWPLFGELGYDHDRPPGEGSNAWMTDPDPVTGATALDFDALEVVNRFSWPLYLEVRRDWFALMDAGWFLTGTGNSDSHALEVETAGLPVNLVAMARPAPGEALDLGAFVTALQERRVMVSTGPIVELTVASGAVVGVPGDTLAAQGPFTATVRVRAAPWVPVAEARLVVGGEVVQKWVIPQPAEGQGVDATFSAPIGARSGPTWVVAEAGWPIEDAPETRLGPTYPLVAPGHRPIGFTNAVRVTPPSP